MAQENIGAKTLLKGTCLVCGEEFFGLNVCPNDGTAIQLVKEDPLVGNILAERFEVLAKLGEGGMSAVYKARHMLMDRIVAIKLLFASDIQSLKRFQLEAKLACNLNHINIVSVFDFGVSTQGQPYLVMDYLEGRSLGDCVKVDGPMQLDRALGIFTQACDALTYAHKRDVIHRDLKPSNFMLVLDDNYSELLKVVDFGIAKQINFEEPAGQGLTKTGEVFGSPLYMAPEQCLGRKLDARADIYSMGCVMYEVLTGQPPLVGVNALDTLHKHINEDPAPFVVTNPACKNLPPLLEKLVFKALARDVEQRYQSMLELWTDLEVLRHAAKGGSAKAAVPVPTVSPSPPPVNPGLINTIPQGMAPPLSPHESLHRQAPTVPPGYAMRPQADSQSTSAAPPFYGQPSRPPQPNQPQQGGFSQTGHNMRGTQTTQGRTQPPGPGMQPQGRPQAPGQGYGGNTGAYPPNGGQQQQGQGNKTGNRMPGLPTPFVQGGPTISPGNVEQDATVISQRMQPVQNPSGNYRQQPPNVVGGGQQHLTSGQDDSRGGQAGSEWTSQMQRTSGSTSAYKGGARTGDSSRNYLPAQKEKEAKPGLPVVPLSIAAAVLLLGGSAFFYLNGQSGTGNVAKTDTSKSNTTAISGIAPTSNWQESQKQGVKALEDANYQLAFRLLNQAMTKAKGHPLDEEYGQLLAQYGQAASKTDHFGEAIDSLTQAQSIFGALNNTQAELLAADCKNYLGLVYTNQMDFENAKAFLNEAKTIRDKVGKPEDKADSDQAMAKLYNRFEKHDGTYGTDAAIKMLQDSLVGKANDPAFVIESKNDLGFSYIRKHEFRQARYYFDQALQSAKDNFGDKHPLYADSLVGLGTLNFLEDKSAIAQNQFEQALAIRRANYGDNTIKAAEVYACLGYLASSQKQMDKAKTYFESALKIKRDLLGPENGEYKANDAAYHQVLGSATAPPRRGRH